MNRTRSQVLGLLLIGSLVFPTAAAAATPPAPAAFPVGAANVLAVPTQTLTGTVTAENGSPLSGARVEVFQYGGGLVAALATGADGYFAAAVPATGDRLYWVRAWAADHETAEQVWVRGQEASLRMTLAPLYGSVTGWVESADGTPLKDARVELVHPTRPALVTTTTHEGRFWFRRVAAAEGYSVRAAAAGKAPVVKPVGSVEAGGETSLSLSLPVFQGQVTGAVVDKETGAPLGKVEVAVEQVGLGIVASTVTDARGVFSANVPAAAGASYQVHAHRQGYIPTATGSFQLDDQGRGRLEGESRVQLAPLATDVTVRVLDADGEPLAKAPLWLEREGIGIVATGTTAEDGTYRFVGVPAGGLRYRVRLVADQMYTRSGLRNWEAAASEWVTPVPGQWLTLGLSTVRGYLHNYGEAEVLGRVTASDQRPLAGAKVELIRAGGGVVATAETTADGTYKFVDVEANLPEEEPADSLRMMVRPKEPGTGYVVRVSHENYHAAASQVINLKHEQQAVADLTLASLRGTAVVQVRDQEGRPVADATVRLYPAEGGEAVEAKSGTAGSARLVGRTLGTYRIEVERNGYHKAQVAPVQLVSGQDTVVDVTLGETGGTLYGSVSDSQGRPFTRPLTVAALAADGREVTETVRPDGSFSLSGLLPGAPALVSLREGTKVLSAPAQVVTAGAGARARVDLTVVGETGSVRGQVVDAAGQPAAGVTVSLMRSGDGSVATAITDANGLYRFEGLQAGTSQRYAVRVDRAGFGYRQVGHRLPPQLFLLQDGGAQYVDLVLTPLP